MAADQLNRRQRNQRHVIALADITDDAFLDDDAFLHVPVRRKQQLARANAVAHHDHRLRIVGIDHRPIVMGLIRKHLHLRFRVLRDRCMPVEVVR